MLSQNPRLAAAKNTFSRSSLHVAVLNQHESLTQQIAQHSPHTLLLGDNVSISNLKSVFSSESPRSLAQLEFILSDNGVEGK